MKQQRGARHDTTRHEERGWCEPGVGVRGELVEGGGRGVEAQEVDKGLVRQAHVAALAAQAGEPEPVVDVLDGRDHHRVDGQHVLPHLDVALAAAQALGPDTADHGLALLDVGRLVLDHLLHLDQLLHLHHHLVGPVVGLAHQGAQLRVQQLARPVDVLVRLLVVLLVQVEYRLEERTVGLMIDTTRWT